MENRRFKNLINNTILFALGTFGSKLIVFIMIPLYTAVLSKEEYGTTDLVNTTVSLLTPVLSLCISESVLRFGMEESISNKKVLSNATVVTFVSGILLTITIPILLWLNSKMVIYVCLILYAQIVQTLLAQYAKATKRVDIYAKNGILLSFFIASLNILFLVVFRKGASGYLIASFIALLISNVWLIFKLKLYKEFSIKLIDKKTIFTLLRYSVPLIPSSIAIWINNVSSRYFILFFLGKSANGIFAAVNKIPMLIAMGNTIFFQAWQMTAIEVFNLENKDYFYTKMFNLYVKFLMIEISGILVITRPLLAILVSSNYGEVWQYVPFLLTGMLYFSLFGFYGEFYIAAKATKGIFISTAVGAVINILNNIILIPKLGIYGAGLSSTFSFMIIWFIRVVESKKIVNIVIDWKAFISNHCIICIQISVLYILANNQLTALTVELFLFFMLVYMNREIFSLLKN